MSIDPALFQENERTAPASDLRQFAQVGSLACEHGGFLPEVIIAYETWGTLNSQKDNAILVCHALSGDSHAIGWWERMIGPDKPIDTNEFFVIGTNALGGCQGTTGPASISEDGKPYRTRFPMISVGDMVEVQSRLIDQLNIEQLHGVAGGSMGGMQVLEWTVRKPARVKKAFVTASSASHNAMQIGFNEAGRQAIMRDPRWNGGMYEEGSEPDGGLAVARMIGHLSFLSEQAFEAKFGRELQSKSKADYHLATDFQVESYLNYQGDKFTKRFDANSLLYLTKAIDYYQLSSFEPAEADFLFASFTTDWLYPTHQSETLLKMAQEVGLRAEHKLIDLPYGHDAFLLDGEIQGEHVRNFFA